MDAKSQITDLPSFSASSTFVKGFLLRLLYGSLAVPFLVWVHPEFLGKALFNLLTVYAAYTGLCLAGGLYDVSTCDTRRVQLFFRNPVY